MKPITHKEIKAARYAVLLRNLSVVAEKLVTYIEDNPTDLQGAKSALRHVRRIVSAKTTAHIERRMPPAEAALFVDSWNDLATGLASIAPKQQHSLQLWSVVCMAGACYHWPQSFFPIVLLFRIRLVTHSAASIFITTETQPKRPA